MEIVSWLQADTHLIQMF